MRTQLLSWYFLGVGSAATPRLKTVIRPSAAGTHRCRASYLRIVGPIYGLYSLGMAFYFATQGLGRQLITVASNGLRLTIGAGAGVLALYSFKADAMGMFLAISLGFVAYGGVNALALVCIKAPADSR